MRKILTTMTAALLNSCASSINVASTPDAVELLSINSINNTESSLGNTPTVIPLSKNKKDFFHLKLSKPGYITQYSIIPFISAFKEDLNLKISLKKQNSDWFETSMRGIFIRETDSILREFLDLQKKIIKGDDQECLRLINIMKQQYGKVAAFHSLVGAYHWTRNNLTEAKRSYERILELVPSDVEASKMLSVINVMMGT